MTHIETLQKDFTQLDGGKLSIEEILSLPKDVLIPMTDNKGRTDYYMYVCDLTPHGKTDSDSLNVYLLNIHQDGGHYKGIKARLNNEDIRRTKGLYGYFIAGIELVSRTTDKWRWVGNQFNSEYKLKFTDMITAKSVMIKSSKFLYVHSE